METSTIKKTLTPDWKGTLKSIEIGQVRTYELDYRAAMMMRQVASRMKKNGEAEYETRTIDGGRVQFKRIK